MWLGDLSSIKNLPCLDNSSSTHSPTTLESSLTCRTSLMFTGKSLLETSSISMLTGTLRESTTSTGVLRAILPRPTNGGSFKLRDLKMRSSPDLKTTVRIQVMPKSTPMVILISASVRQELIKMPRVGMTGQIGTKTCYGSILLVAGHLLEETWSVRLPMPSSILSETMETYGKPQALKMKRTTMTSTGVSSLNLEVDQSIGTIPAWLRKFSRTRLTSWRIATGTARSSAQVWPLSLFWTTLLTSLSGLTLLFSLQVPGDGLRESLPSIVLMLHVSSNSSCS